MRRIKHQKPSKKRREQPKSHIHLRDIGAWIVKTLLVPVITSVLCQYLIAWLDHLLKW
jgi:hypothetical protein